MANLLHFDNMVIIGHRIHRQAGWYWFTFPLLSTNSKMVMGSLLYIIWNGLNFVEECLAMQMEKKYTI